VNAYFVVCVAFVLYALASWLSYHPSHKDRVWFPWLMVSISATGGFLWMWVVRLCDTKRDLYSAAVAWDVAVMVAYSVLPLLVFGVKLSPVAWVGFWLVVIGAILVKQG
jgi:uncharacterized membrane protein